MYKKGDPANIANYRPIISLMSNIYKLFSCCLNKKTSINIDKNQPVEQAGFRSGFSTIDHLQVVSQVIEKYKEFNKQLYVGFVDYCKAFDTVSHNSIWSALKELEVNDSYIQTIQNIYKASKSRVRLERTGASFNIERVVKQGDPMSPKLFIAVLEYAIRNIDWSKRGVRIKHGYLSHLRFADDVVLFARNADELQ